MMKKKKEKHGKYNLSYPLILGIFLAGLAIAGGIILPELLLEHAAGKQLTVVETAPESYYLATGTAMAKNASEKLSSLDRIKLISGEWDSRCVQVNPDEGTLSEAEIIALTKQQLEYYYGQNVYPYSLSSSYNNWYSWSTELYCYTDTVFNTYTTYLWVVHFTRYDDSLTHTILITENGTILGAQVSDNSKSFSPVKQVYQNVDINKVLGDKNITVDSISTPIDDMEIPEYPYIDTTGIKEKKIYCITLSYKTNDVEEFYIYQYKTDTAYGFGIAP